MATVNFKTRINKDASPVETSAEVSFEGVSQEQLEALAMSSVIIKAQATYRIAGEVPAEDVIIVADLLKRERGGFKSTPESIAAKYAKMSDADKARLLALLDGPAAA